MYILGLGLGNRKIALLSAAVLVSLLACVVRGFVAPSPAVAAGGFSAGGAWARRGHGGGERVPGGARGTPTRSVRRVEGLFMCREMGGIDVGEAFLTSASRAAGACGGPQRGGSLFSLAAFFTGLKTRFVESKRALMVPVSISIDMLLSCSAFSHPSPLRR